MKLKTLKDLQNENPTRDVLDVDIRQEAIKWVKDCCDRKLKCLGCKRMMRFHNITEEDLKGGKDDGKSNR